MLCDMINTGTDISNARQKIFSMNPYVKQILPTRADLEQRVKTATYQGGHVWGKTLLPNPALSSPTNWGQINTDDGITNTSRSQTAFNNV